MARTAVILVCLFCIVFFSFGLGLAEEQRNPTPKQNQIQMQRNFMGLIVLLGLAILIILFTNR